MVLNETEFASAFTGGFVGGGLATLIALGIAFMLLVFAIAIILYVIKALALMRIAKRTKTKNSWLAWIPIADFYLLTQTARQSGWWTLLYIGVIIPFVSGIAWLALCIISIWLLWTTAKRLRMNGVWSLLAIIPGVGFVIALAIYAWKK
ncbi:MAG: hypothetical protein AABX03_01690 [Nanoarchaeota archaeon]